ncbi:sulfurtransferase TusA family protein [Paracoccus endophyticus]|uniref:sulfurtransferase TusA family protein n=1 Tax=Paracoccus endophyticus TaxID=2233774 RepID=UPI000DDAF066|nr:sulfurtransferase TusA family protein [Paracoccus endophyticus]
MTATADPAAPLELDARHLLCPLPVLRLRRALSALPPGAQVALIATDPAAVLDVPHFCAEAGHVLLDQAPTPDGARRYLVQRG